MRRILLLAATALGALALGGCTVPAGDATPPPPAGATARSGKKAAPAALEDLKKGMAAAEVIARWGQPDARKPLETSAGNGEVWTYRHVVGRYQRQVPTGTREVPYVDPLTGVAGFTSEPVYSQENVEVVRTTSLLIFQDHLVEWNVSQAERSALL